MKKIKEIYHRLLNKIGKKIESIILKLNNGVKIKGIITLDVIRGGKVISHKVINNLITNVGLAEIANLAGNVSSPIAFTYLAVGTGTTAASASNTTLETEITDSGLARASATVSRQTTNVSNDTLQLSKTWSVSGTKSVTEAGILNASSGGTLLGRQVFTAVNVVNGDSLTITYKVVFS